MSRHGRHIYNNSSRVSEKADEGDRRFYKYIGRGRHDTTKSHDMMYYDSNIDNNKESDVDTYIPFTKDIDYLLRHENNYYNKKYPSTTSRRPTTITTYYDGYDNHPHSQPHHRHKQPSKFKSRDNDYNRKKTQEKMDQISRNSKNIMNNDKYDHKNKDKYKKSMDKLKPIETQTPLPLPLPLPLIIPLKSSTINNTKKPTYKSNIKISGDYSGDEKDFYFIPFKEPTPSLIPPPPPPPNVSNMVGIVDNQTTKLNEKDKDTITKDDDSDIEIVEIFDNNEETEYNSCVCGDYSTCSEDECYMNHR
jgi:hypothetical protein